VVLRRAYQRTNTFGLPKARMRFSLSQMFIEHTGNMKSVPSTCVESHKTDEATGNSGVANCPVSFQGRHISWDDWYHSRRTCSSLWPVGLRIKSRERPMSSESFQACKSDNHSFCDSHTIQSVLTTTLSSKIRLLRGCSSSSLLSLSVMSAIERGH
jgi:hypothetical protein